MRFSEEAWQLLRLDDGVHRCVSSSQDSYLVEHTGSNEEAPTSVEDGRCIDTLHWLQPIETVGRRAAPRAERPRRPEELQLHAQKLLGKRL